MKNPLRRNRLSLVVTMVCLAQAAWPCLAAEETEVSLRKVEDRTEATVISTARSASEHSGKKIPPGNPLSAMEKESMAAAGASTTVVGKGADQTVEAVKSVGSSAFSWLFKALDFTHKHEEASHGGQKKEIEK